MAVSDRPWSDFSDADYTPEQYCAASLIDMNPAGKPKVKDMCKLRVREPSGTLNRNGAHAAASVLGGGRGGVMAPPDEKRAAARKLLGIYRSDLKETPPDSLVRLAG